MSRHYLLSRSYNVERGAIFHHAVWNYLNLASIRICIRRMIYHTGTCSSRISSADLPVGCRSARTCAVERKLVERMGIEPTTRSLQGIIASEEHASPQKLEHVKGIAPSASSLATTRSDC